MDKNVRIHKEVHSFSESTVCFLSSLQLKTNLVFHDKHDFCSIFSFWLYWVFVAAVFSLVAASQDHSVVAVCELLIAVVSLVVEQSLKDALASVVVAPGLQSTGLIALHLCGIFPE